MLKSTLTLWVIFTVALANGALAETRQESPPPANPEESVASAPLGSSSNPVKCDMPRGERAYIKRLNCPDGSTPKFVRRGSFHQEHYPNILDAYSLTCGDKKYELSMDMYHRSYVEERAIPGFTIDPPNP